MSLRRLVLYAFGLVVLTFGHLYGDAIIQINYNPIETKNEHDGNTNLRVLGLESATKAPPTPDTTTVSYPDQQQEEELESRGPTKASTANALNKGPTGRTPALPSSVFNNCKKDPSKELVIRAVANHNDTCRFGGDDDEDGSFIMPCWISGATGNNNIEQQESSLRGGGGSGSSTTTPALCMDHSLEDTAMKFIPSPGYPTEKLAFVRGPGTVLMNDGRVLTPGGLVITRSGGCCPFESTIAYPSVNYSLPKNKIDQIPNPSIVQNGVYMLEQHHMLRYYHFLEETLPRLEYFIDELVKDGGVYSNLKIRVSPEAMKYDFVHQAIALMGISADRIYATKEEKQYTPWWIPNPDDDDLESNNKQSDADDPTSGLVVVPPGTPGDGRWDSPYIQSEGARIRSMARRMLENACKVAETKERFDRVYWERACGGGSNSKEEKEGTTSSDDPVNVVVINRGDSKRAGIHGGGDHKRNIVNHEELMSSLHLQFEQYFNGNDHTQTMGGHLRSDSDMSSTSTSRQLQDHDMVKETVLEIKEFLKGTTAKSMADDVVMFGGADIVVAPHGAGTTNLIFMGRPGGLVIELYCEGQGGRAFGWLAMRLGHKFCEVSDGMSWAGDKETLEKRASRPQMSLPMRADLDVVMPQIMACVHDWWEDKKKKKL